jgi:ferredoxin
MRLTIDHRTVDVAPGKTILEAATLMGIDIPVMCHLEGSPHHSSCMICLVQNTLTGKYIPSCAMPAEEGMVICTTSDEIVRLRREALELMHSHHAGDCEAPCRLSCPAFMDIPQMNRLIASGDFTKALEVVREEIALPLILGYICPAPCEKACHRAQVDAPVSICLLKRFTASGLTGNGTVLHPPVTRNGKEVAVIGSGPAGLSAAFYLNRLGYDVTVFESAPEAGGALRYAIGDDRLPRTALDAEIASIAASGVRLITSCRIGQREFEEEIVPRYAAVILATGNREQHDIAGLLPAAEGGDGRIDPHTGRTARSGLFACGNAVRVQPMAVRSAAQGKAVALEVHRFLDPLADIPHRIRFNSALGRLQPSEADELMKEGSPIPRLEPGEGWRAGFSGEEAMAEAARCMHCDCRSKSACTLRELSEAYHARRKVFRDAERPRVKREVRHELLVWEPGKCIQCGRCVAITAQEKELPGLTFIGRGFDVRIAVPLDGAFSEALKQTAMKCAEACPTGALEKR